MVRACQLFCNEVFSHRDKIVEHALSIFKQCALMPLGTVFTTTADIRQHIGAAPCQPGLALGRHIGGCSGQLKSSIGGKACRCCAGHWSIAVAHQIVRNCGPIRARGEVLFDRKRCGIELRGQSLDCEGGFIAADEIQRRWGQEALIIHHQGVIERICAYQSDRAIFR